MNFANDCIKEFGLIFNDTKSVILAFLTPLATIFLFSGLNIEGNIIYNDPTSFVCCLAIVFSSLSLSTQSIVHERVSGTLNRFEKTPGAISEFVLSKYLAQVSLSFMQSTFLFVLLVIMLPDNVAVGDITILPIFFLVGMSTIALGMFFSSLVSNEIQATQFSAFGLIVMVVIGGFFQSLDKMGALGDVAKALPFTQGYQALYIYFKGDPQDILYWILLIIEPIVFIILSVFVIQRRK